MLRWRGVRTALFQSILHSGPTLTIGELHRQYCQGIGSFKPTNHLHHEDGAFQEYIALDAGYITILPQDVDPVLAAPTLCAGLTAYKAVLNADPKPGQ